MRTLVAFLLGFLFIGNIFATPKTNSTNEGLNYHVTDNEESSSSKHQAKTQAALTLERALIGNWENAMYPFEFVAEDPGTETNRVVDGAYLTYEFFDNGTYLKRYGGDDIHIVEKGHWEVANTGKLVTLRSSRVRASEEIKIKYIELDELVIEQDLYSEYKAFRTTKKNFFFNRR